MITIDYDSSHEWFRKSALKSEVAAIQQMGLESWKEKNPAVQDPCLIASYMKMLCREVPDGLIHKTMQDLLMHLLKGGKE